MSCRYLSNFMFDRLIKVSSNNNEREKWTKFSSDQFHLGSQKWHHLSLLSTFDVKSECLTLYDIDFQVTNFILVRLNDDIDSTSIMIETWVSYLQTTKLLISSHVLFDFVTITFSNLHSNSSALNVLTEMIGLIEPESST